MSDAGGATRILVVDDQETSLYNKSRILRRAGFEIVEARTGLEAMERVADSKPRLVVCDVQLPGIDGWEVCRRIKASPETAMIPVLQMSATYVREADTVRALEGGADACLTEPVEPPVLVATVRALLRARAAEDALRESLEREQAARIAAETANRAKDEFLATVSHELRSPLGVILSWVTLLRGHAVDPVRVAHGLEAVERNARLQSRLIADLLDVSAIMSGKLGLELAVVDLAQVLERALEAVRPAAEVKSVALSVTTDPEPLLVSGDASRLQQVLWNVLSNAVKFTPAGGRVEVVAERVDTELRVRVSDTGKGIAPELLPHVFERFRQGDSSTTRSEGGLGLGLAIVRHLVELHGGRVDAVSPGPGAGATFTVHLPVAPVLAHAASAVGGSAPLASLEGLRVLVVDDDADAREAIAGVLSQAGARVETAGSAAEAVAAVSRARPDLVVSDIGMPGEDGFDLLRRLRALGREFGGGWPVLALTAYTGGENRARILEAGFDAHVTKPIEAGELAAAVARLAGRIAP